ncbi:hypothetical protein TRVL_07583 [Trypanosoma vivax]|nr:hypothetical protein TRVL_07583 [Trypanosoma vivax]
MDKDEAGQASVLTFRCAPTGSVFFTSGRRTRRQRQHRASAASKGGKGLSQGPWLQWTRGQRFPVCLPVHGARCAAPLRATSEEDGAMITDEWKRSRLGKSMKAWKRHAGPGTQNAVLTQFSRPSGTEQRNTSQRKAEKHTVVDQPKTRHCTRTGCSTTVSEFSVVVEEQ